MNKTTAEQKSQRRHVIFTSSIVNVTLLIVLAWLWYQDVLTTQTIAMLWLVLFVFLNGALWLGWRVGQTQLMTGPRRKPLIFFTIGVLCVLYAIVEFFSTDFGSAGMLLVAGVGMITLGILMLKNDKGSKDVNAP